MGEGQAINNPENKIKLVRAIIKRQLSYMQDTLRLDFDILGMVDGRHVISTKDLDWNGSWELLKMWDMAVGRASAVEMSGVRIQKDKEDKIECEFELRCSENVFGSVENFDRQLFSARNEDARILTSWVTDETHEKGLWDFIIS